MSIKVKESRFERLRRPVLRNAGKPAAEIDLTGCVLAVSSTSLSSMAIRLKQVDGLNHNAVVTGRSTSDPTKWKVTEATGRGCKTADRHIPRGYVIRFDDADTRRRIAEAAMELGDRGWGYDYMSIAWHLCDFGVWAVPCSVGGIALWRAVRRRDSARTLAVGALALNPTLRLARLVIGRFDRTDRKICSELTIDILRQAEVPIPAWLARGSDSRYRPTPIDLTRWLLGRDDWDQSPSRAWRLVKIIAGVHYRVQGAPDLRVDQDPIAPPGSQVTQLY